VDAVNADVLNEAPHAQQRPKRRLKERRWLIGSALFLVASIGSLNMLAASLDKTFTKLSCSMTGSSRHQAPDPAIYQNVGTQFVCNAEFYQGEYYVPRPKRSWW
jgi:hypothetical protein